VADGEAGLERGGEVPAVEQPEGEQERGGVLDFERDQGGWRGEEGERCEQGGGEGRAVVGEVAFGLAALDGDGGVVEVGGLAGEDLVAGVVEIGEVPTGSGGDDDAGEDAGTEDQGDGESEPVGHGWFGFAAGVGATFPRGGAEARRKTRRVWRRGRGVFGWDRWVWLPCGRRGGGGDMRRWRGGVCARR
jgi:hypothetical protein